MAKIGLIGMGNMGYAILKGLLCRVPKKDLLFTCKRKVHAEEVKKETGVSNAPDNFSCARAADIVILAVKPQIYKTVLKEIAPAVTEKKILISLAPGISIDSLKKELGEKIRIVRAMPNIPAEVREGMTGVSCREKEFTAAEKKKIEEIFTSFGRMVWVDEKLMDTVTVMSGSSPAFVYMFIDAMADAGVRYGLKKSDALIMASQAVLGSAKMVLETGEHPAVLKDRVCSPGGTTIAGVAALEEEGFRRAVLNGCDAVYHKCKAI
jgi:pyrroline-5-carboxylate reductase